MSALDEPVFRRRRTPVVLQTEAAECGLACLVMVAYYHGFKTDLATLRGRFSMSLTGANLAHIISFADRLGFNARAVRLDIEDIRDLTAPCILHWDLNHFVVLQRANTEGIFIHDPAVGVRRLAYPEVSKHFTGIALELSPSAEFRPAVEERKVSLAQLVGKVTGLRRSFFMILVMALALEGLALATPLINQWFVDEALVSGDRSLLNILALSLLLLMLTQTALSQARGWAVMFLSTHLNLQWISNVFSHLLRLPVAWFEKRHVGDIVSRFGSVSAIQNTLTTTFIGAVLDGIMALATCAMMLTYSPSLWIVIIGTTLVYALLRAAWYSPLRVANQESLVTSAKEESYFLESVRSIQAIKLYGRELDRRVRWQNLAVESINRGVRTQKLALSFESVNTAIVGIAATMVLWLGGIMVMEGKFTVGMLLTFTAYAGQFGTRMAALVDSFVQYKMLSLHAERLADIVLEPIEEQAPPDRRIDQLIPRIQLVDVSFRYSEHDPWVLRHVNLIIEPGEAVAITGPSGCGKTTLLKLILNLLSPCEGEIRYGGIPIAQLGVGNYRAHLSVVMQNDQLLSGSLADNISFFDDKPDRGRIEMCATLAAVHHDIMATTMGYETLTGDMGSSLSGGQKQRILLARALYKRPKVLVLDEATSHLDVSLERQVNAAVASLDVTRVIVAHRPETIAIAERVIVMAEGRIVQELEINLTN